MKHVCPWWLAYTFDNPLRKIIHNTEKLLCPYVNAGMTVADIGCGMGYFSIGMARMVGETGKVISVDVQPKMLGTLAKRAIETGVADRITRIMCDESNIGVTETVDFALAFWMVHETPDQRSFLKQVHSILGKSGKLLVAEPKLHVTLREFNKTLCIAQEVGFRSLTTPDVHFSHSALLEKQ